MRWRYGNADHQSGTNIELTRDVQKLESNPKGPLEDEVTKKFAKNTKMESSS